MQRQQASYIERQLAAFAQGIRQNDILEQMRIIAGAAHAGRNARARRVLRHALKRSRRTRVSIAPARTACTGLRCECAHQSGLHYFSQRLRFRRKMPRRNSQKRRCSLGGRPEDDRGRAGGSRTQSPRRSHRIDARALVSTYRRRMAPGRRGRSCQASPRRGRRCGPPRGPLRSAWPQAHPPCRGRRGVRRSRKIRRSAARPASSIAAAPRIMLG